MIAFAAALFLQAASPPARPSFEALSKQAIAAREAGHMDEALALYKKALRLKPDWDEGLWEAGSIEYDRDKYDDCSTDFEHLASVKLGQPPPLTMAGLCEYHARKYEAALKSLQEARRLGSKEPGELDRATRLHLALVLIKLNAFEKAITTLVELTRSYKKTPDIIVASGIAGLREAWTPPEVPEAERDKVFKLGDAMAAVMEQDSKEAFEKFAIVLHDYPKDANVHFRYGSYMLQQDPDRGVEELRKVLDLDPNHIPTLVGLAAIYRKRGDMTAARGYADRAVKLAPEDFATHVTLGRVLLDMDDPADAMRELELATKLAPGSPEAHFNLAVAYAKMGRREDAAHEREEFQRLRKMTEDSGQL
ncbi:MAG TPA: tetratricopeptide repeat protein [Bryobacteraceae bacterium]|nr:tetratricopeptide repeat protein [Bryobacteraceae bacterium]